MKIQYRFLFLTVLITLLSIVAALLVSNWVFREALVQNAHDMLSAVLEARHSAVSRHLDIVHKEMHVIASSPSTAKLLMDLPNAFQKLGGNAQLVLQQNYRGRLPPNYIPEELKHTEYAQLHATAAAFFARRTEYYGWQDIFLIDTQGNVLFSTVKESDFATNLVKGPWQDSGLARAVKPLLQNAVPDQLSFADFSAYGPSQNQSASFIAMPVFDNSKHQFIGVVAIQLPLGQLSDLLNDKTGMGKTGVSFLVGKDGWILTPSVFTEEGRPPSMQLKTQAVQRVLKGESGLELYLDFRNVPVYVAFKSLKVYGEEAILGEQPTWGVIAKIDQAEVLKQFYWLQRVMIALACALILFASILAVLGASSITKPLLNVRNALVRLAKREQVDVPELQRHDEIGEIARAAEVFRNMALQVEHDHWISGNVSNLTSAVSAETSLASAATQILHILCTHLAVPVAAIYVVNQDGGCQRVAAQGLAQRNVVDDHFASGIGLVGQCAKDGQALVLSPVPANLLIISTGLTEFSPQELVLYPIQHKHHVFAVLELACSTHLTPVQHELLKAVSDELGLHLANLQAAEHNVLLLEETQAQSKLLIEQQSTLLKNNTDLRLMSEELRSQAEEMKVQNEELKANQEELRAQQDEMQQKNLLLQAQTEQLKATMLEAQSKSVELQRANQYKSEFLANMSHELRTPLNSVLILSRNLAENEAGNLNAEQVESAMVISESGTQLLTLINDILDLSKIEAGKLELHHEQFAISELLAYLQRIFLPQAEKKQLGFEFQLDKDTPDQICTDRQRLTQVLSNLLSNAIKFTEHGQILLLVKSMPDSICFEVHDTGIGIPPDKLEHIFGAFQQLDGSISRKYGGSGLGLAISRHLTRLLGGEIVVNSKPSIGSCFSVKLQQTPLQVTVAPPHNNTACDQHPTEINVHHQSILVVEDDAALLNVLGRMIKALGQQVVCVDSAEAALDVLQQQLPCGILLDLGLPKMHGMELLRLLKQQPETAHIPVYIMSGGTDSGEAKTLGALGFLKKPVTRDTINFAIQNMLQQPSALKRLLIVDSSAHDVKEIQQLFDKDSLQIVVAHTGDESLQFLVQQHFDCVILDLQIVDMSWQTWVAQAGQLTLLPPVVVYSAHELNEQEVFVLKGVSESIVTQAGLNSRLREEVLRAVQLGPQSQLMSVQSGKKLLVVDDDARNLFALTKVLRSKGFEIETAAEGQQALQKIQHASFDAVLTDIMMPELDGYALTRQIRELGYTNLPIIAITAKSMQGDETLCLQAGANAYFSKPVDVSKLLKFLQNI